MARFQARDRRRAAEEKEKRSSAGGSSAAAATASNAASETEFLASVPAYRNLYFLSKLVAPVRVWALRVVAAPPPEVHRSLHCAVAPKLPPPCLALQAHHLTATYTVDGGPPQTQLFVGRTLRDVQAAPAMPRGPCCAYHAADVPDAVHDVPADVRDAVRQKLLKTVAGAAVDVTGVHAHGMHGSCAVTEFIVRTPPSASVVDDLAHEICRDLAADSTTAGHLSEMDRLDLEMMQGILSKPVPTTGPRRGRPSGGGPLPLPGFAGAGAGAGAAAGAGVPAFGGVDPAALRAVAVCTGTVFFDAEGRPLDASVHHTTHSVCSLADLRPRRDAAWVDYQPAADGTLVLAHPLPPAGAVKALITAVQAVWRTWVDGGAVATDPPPSLTEPPRAPYREVRSMTVVVKPVSATKLPDDVAAAETAPPLATATVPLDVHAAVHAPPHRASATFDALGLAVHLETRLDAAGANTLTLHVEPLAAAAGGGGTPPAASIPLALVPEALPGSAAVTCRGAGLFASPPPPLRARAVVDGVAKPVRVVLRDGLPSA